MKTLILLSTALFLISCKNQSRSYDFDRYTETNTNLENENNDLSFTARLNRVTDLEFEDPEIQKMQDLIDQTRKKRSLELLNKYSEPKERIDISKVELAQVNNDRFKINVETIEELTNEKQTLIFVSNDDNQNELIGFDFISGKNIHEVKARGYCLDLEEGVCRNIVIEVSYILKGTKIIRQFNFGKEKEPEAKEEEIEEEIEDTELQHEHIDEVIEETKEEHTNPVQIKEKSNIDVQSNIDISGIVSPKTQEVEVILPDSSDDKVRRIKKPSELVMPDTDEKPIFVDRDSGREQDQIDVDQTVEETKETVELNNEKVVVKTPNIGSDINPRAAAPNKPFQPTKDTLPIVDTEPHKPLTTEVKAKEQATTALKSSPRPKARPETLVSKYAPVSSVRPLARPSNLKTGSLAPTSSKRPVARPRKTFKIVEGETVSDTEEVSLSPGVFILPDSDDETPLHLRDLGVETGSYADLEDEEETPSDNKYEGLLSEIRTKTYNQSKGSYGGSLGRGWLKNSSAVNNDDGDSVVPKRSSKKYGSGMTTGFLKWLGKEYLSKYRNDTICVNDLSAKNGGDLSNHASHENGLDIDMNIPTSARDCTKKSWNDYRSNLKKDRDFYDKNYDLLKLIIGSGKVHVVFIDKSFIKNMCEHTKKMNLSSDELKERKVIFNKLYHIGGHANHYHIRMVCNEQNLGCKSQGRLKPNVATSCD